ncbi:TetR/AcrR family transcriptional regulator [Microbacterium aoyamense]|uniref:TetR/AcrR family transcriptional regulator n=1 Tax=Microbacterium aoyamense TaxID=344166 RepID=A0ABP5B2V3_9MICO|nr:TetR/AcrR family transcriptional regulator [Microbacterium aoyamense]
MPTPDRTSLADIVAAGRSLLETGGPSAVTMSAVAARVGVRAPSLYKRVRDRDALIVLIAEATADALTERLAASDPSIPGYARTFRAFAHEQPEGFRLIFTTDGAAAATARSAAPLLVAVRDVVGPEHELDAARLFTAWAMGFVTMELAGGFRMGGDVDGAFEFGLAAVQSGLAAQAPRAPGQVLPAHGS